MPTLEKTFELKQRGSTVRQEIIAGLTTFLAMVYSVIVVPNMLGAAGFPAESVFIATCLVAGLGSILIGLWANAPMAIGCAISLTAFTAFSLVIGQKVAIPVALGAVFLMGVVFTLISATGIRAWILRNLPSSIAHGAGIGIGLFLLLIAANGVGLVVSNQAGLPVKLGDFTSFPVMMSLIGLALIIGLEKMKIKIINKSKHPLPKYQTELSAGMDLYANITEPVRLGSLERTIIPTGIFIALPAGYEAQVRPRSGLAAKHGITCLNSPGTIDADYRGEVGVILANLSKDEFVINDGERIAQLVIAKHETAQWEEIETLDETERGAGGFGSSGTK